MAEQSWFEFIGDGVLSIGYITNAKLVKVVWKHFFKSLKTSQQPHKY